MGMGVTVLCLRPCFLGMVTDACLGPYFVMMDMAALCQRPCFVVTCMAALVVIGVTVTVTNQQDFTIGTLIMLIQNQSSIQSPVDSEQ